jgi:hypothetical protein
MAPIGIGALAGVALGPLGLVAGLFCAGAAWTRLERQRLTAAKAELRQVFHVRLQELNRHFFGVDVGAHRFSLVDEYFDAAEKALLKYVDETTSRRIEETDAESARLSAQAALESEARAREVETVRDQLRAWDQLGSTLMTLADRDGAVAEVA